MRSCPACGDLVVDIEEICEVCDRCFGCCEGHDDDGRDVEWDDDAAIGL